MTTTEKKIIQELNSLIGNRYNMETLKEKAIIIFGNNIAIELVENDCSDWNIMINSYDDETYGYYDVYVLMMKNKGFDGSTFYVTEVSYEFDF